MFLFVKDGVAAQIIDSSQQMDNSDNYFTNG